MREEILILSEEEITQVLSVERVIEISDQVFRAVGQNEVVFAHEAFLAGGLKAGNRFLANPVSFPREGVAGLKWISMYMEPEAGYPFSHGNIIVLNDLRTASPLAVVGASRITEMRTAGGHAAVAAKYLSIAEIYDHSILILEMRERGRFYSLRRRIIFLVKRDKRRGKSYFSCRGLHEVLELTGCGSKVSCPAVC